MNKLTMIATLCVVLLLCAAPAWAAQNEAAEQPAAPVAATPGPEGFSIYMGTAFACGLIIIGAAYGIGRIGSAAVESMARQPEVAGNINQAMIIAAALVEGVTFFALIVCLLNVFFK